MKKLFDEDERYTEEGKALAHELSDALQPIMEKYLHDGFLKREVSYIAMTTAHVEAAVIAAKMRDLSN